MCAARSEKTKKSSIQYACLSRVIEEGGLLAAVVSRYSILPPHGKPLLSRHLDSHLFFLNFIVITAIYATCGMKLWVFVASALLSMPQNFVNVYIGSFAEAESQGKTSTSAKIVEYGSIALTTVVTIAAMKYIGAQINRVKPQIIHERRKAR